MKFKDIAILSLVFFSALVQAQNTPIENTLLWKISGKGIKTSYLYGTMHVRDPRAFDFADSVLLAFGSCDAYAMEVHPDSMNKMLFGSIEKYVSKSFYSDDDQLKNEIGIDEYNIIDEKLQRESGISLNQIKNKNPELIRSLLSEAKKTAKDKPVFVDLYLYDLAGGEEKKIYGLESMEASTRRLMNYKYSVKKQYQLEVDAIEQIRSWATLVDDYQRNDLKKIYARFSDSLSFDQEYKKVLLDDRNEIMAHSIDTIVSKATCFFAVGCGHLPGDKGLVTLLRKLGYTLTPVMPVKTGKASMYPVKTAKPHWKSMTDEMAAYEIQYPGESSPIKIPFTETDMHCYYDLGKGMVFFSYGVFTSSEFENTSNKKFYSMLLTQMIKKKEGKLISKEKIELYGSDALKAHVQMLSYDYNIVLFRKGKMLYLLMLGHQNHPDAVKYFDQFIASFKPKDLIEKKLGSFSSSRDAFSANLPGKPTERKMDMGGADLDIRLYLANNQKSGVNYIVQVMEYTNGKYIDQDSAFLQMIGDGASQGFGNVKVLKDEYSRFNGYVSRTMELKEKDVSYSLMLVSRLNRIYNVMATYQPKHKGEVDEFLQSFQFIPFDKAELKSTPFNEGIITLNFPKIYKTDTTDYLSNGVVKELEIHGADKSSSAVYILNVREYSLLHQVNDSSLIEDTKEMFFSENDSLIYGDIKKAGEGYRIEYIYDMPHSVNEKKEVHILAGNTLYSMVVYYVPEQKEGESVKGFFESFAIDNSKVIGNLFADKKVVVKEQLLNPNISANDINDGLKSVKWEESDVDFLFTVLPKQYEDDSLSYFSIKGSLFSALEDLPQEKTLPKMKKLYSKLSARDKVRALNFYSDCRSIASMKELSVALYSDTSIIDADFTLSSILSAMRDSSDLVRELYPKLLPLLDNKIIMQSMYFMLKDALDSNWISREVVLKQGSVIRKVFKEHLNDAKVDFETNPDSYVPYWLNSGVVLMYALKLDNEEIDTQLREAIKLFNDDYFTSEVIIQFLLKDKMIDSDIKDKMFSNQLYQSQIYFAMSKAGKASILPKFMTDEITITKSDLYSYCYSYEEFTPSELNFLEKKTINYNDEEMEFYLFKVINEFDGSRTVYYGVSGAYEKNSFSKGKKRDLTGMLWEDEDALKGLTTDEIIERIIEQGTY